jgi:hypothetical protein
MTSRKTKNIGLSIETYQFLSGLKKPGEPFDDLILRLINQGRSSVGSPRPPPEIVINIDDIIKHNYFVDLLARIVALEEINKHREVTPSG